MNTFEYLRADNVAEAVKAAGAGSEVKYLGGGTNLVDLMREGIERPQTLVDVSALNGGIDKSDGGGLMIGAGVKNTALAADRRVRQRYPLLSRAILAGASGQIRNMASVGGNLLQRTRCNYFYDAAARCNKREPGTGCDARDGFNRLHAIFGASPACVATHSSDMAVALTALDARAYVQGPADERSIDLVNLHTLPGEHPEIETQLREHELITAVEFPPRPSPHTCVTARCATAAAMHLRWCRWRRR